MKATGNLPIGKGFSKNSRQGRIFETIDLRASATSSSSDMLEGLPGRPAMGALRILSRRRGAEILVLHGEDRSVLEGEDLAHVSWWPGPETAERISRFCSELLIAAKAPPAMDGWHTFPAGGIDNLVRVARDYLKIGLVRAVEGPKPWTRQRVARLGFLAGLGWTAKRIADDPLIASTPNNVYQQAHKFGISLSDGPQGVVSARLPYATMAVIDGAARQQQVTRDLLVRRLIMAAAADPVRYGLREAS